MRQRLARWLVAGLLGATLALGSFAPTWLTDATPALADPGGHTGGGG